jgi:hypothetical protein
MAWSVDVASILAALPLLMLWGSFVCISMCRQAGLLSRRACAAYVTHKVVIIAIAYATQGCCTLPNPVTKQTGSETISEPVYIPPGDSTPVAPAGDIFYTPGPSWPSGGANAPCRPLTDVVAPPSPGGVFSCRSKL